MLNPHAIPTLMGYNTQSCVHRSGQTLICVFLYAIVKVKSGKCRFKLMKIKLHMLSCSSLLTISFACHGIRAALPGKNLTKKIKLNNQFISAIRPRQKCKLPNKTDLLYKFRAALPGRQLWQITKKNKKSISSYEII